MVSTLPCVIQQRCQRKHALCTIVQHDDVPECPDIANALSVFPDKMLYVNSGLSTSEALNCNTKVPTVVSSFK